MNRAFALSVAAMTLTIAIATRPSEVVARVSPPERAVSPTPPPREPSPTPTPTPTPDPPHIETS